MLVTLTYIFPVRRKNAKLFDIVLANDRCLLCLQLVSYVLQFRQHILSDEVLEDMVMTSSRLENLEKAVLLFQKSWSWQSGFGLEAKALQRKFSLAFCSIEFYSMHVYCYLLFTYLYFISML